MEKQETKEKIHELLDTCKRENQKYQLGQDLAKQLLKNKYKLKKEQISLITSQFQVNLDLLDGIIATNLCIPNNFVDMILYKAKMTGAKGILKLLLVEFYERLNYQNSLENANATCISICSQDEYLHFEIDNDTLTYLSFAYLMAEHEPIAKVLLQTFNKHFLNLKINVIRDFLQRFDALWGLVKELTSNLNVNKTIIEKCCLQVIYELSNSYLIDVEVGNRIKTRIKGLLSGIGYEEVKNDDAE